MPALSMFFGIIIYMYREQGGQHNIPHIHAEYQKDGDYCAASQSYHGKTARQL